jgi:HSP20 family protein
LTNTRENFAEKRNKQTVFDSSINFGTPLVLLAADEKTKNQTRRCTMTLVKYLPNQTRRMAGLDDFINRFFEDSFSGDVRQSYMPLADIHEDGKSYIITMDIPGYTRKDLKISLEKNVLTIQGEKEMEKRDEKDVYHLRERQRGSFSRSFRMPEDIDEGKISARVNEGVLSISVDKAEEKLPKLIEISEK